MFSRNRKGSVSAVDSRPVVKSSPPSIISADLRIFGDLNSDGEIQIDGTVDGDTLTWKADITSPMAMTLEFTATVDGDSMSGNVKLGAFGDATFTGTRA